MKRLSILIKITVLLLVFLLPTLKADAQCNLSIDTVYYNGVGFITPDTIKICEGDGVLLTSEGGCPTYMMNNDFNNGTAGVGWSSNASPMFTNPCGPGINGTTYLWIGPATTFPRELVTVGYNVTTQCQICFDMMYASQVNSTPCEGPDEPTEGVHLQYSTVGATGPWFDINYWDPVGGTDPVLTTWHNYCENVPVNGLVWFRWYQTNTSGNDYDHWGLDNVQIFCPPPSQVETWTANGTVFYNDFNPSIQYPTVSTLYVEEVTTGTSTATDQVYIDVYPTPTLTISGLNSTYCVNATAANMTGSPTPGVFSGPGVTGTSFNPATAGVGTHTVMYHNYYVTTNTSTGPQTIFNDDFSTDKGWSGYGNGGWTRGAAVASAGCSGNQDPSTDHTTTADNYIIGNYLGNCYPNSMSQTYWLTSPVINCTNLNTCQIEFYSFSGCESPSFDHMYIDVSANGGTTWTSVYSNTAAVSESAWTLRNYTATQANNCATFKVRIGMGVTDGSVTYSGWNIDDFKVKCSGTMTITDTLCDFTTTQDVTVFNQPSSAFTLIDSICIGSTTTFTYGGTSPTTATYNWDFDGGNIISGSGQGPYVIEYTTAGAHPITLTVTDGGCTSPVTSHTLTVLPMGDPHCCVLPTTNAGPDGSICQLTYTMQAVPSVGTGTWTYTGPGIATFVNSNLATTSVTVTMGGAYTFTWTEDNGTGCSNNDNVVITFTQQPVANAGPNISVCQLGTTLQGVASVGAGTWSQISGPGTITFTDANLDTTAITGSLQGTYSLLWTENNGNGCTSTDNVVVTLTALPVVNAGPDDAICSNTYTLAAVSSVGTGTWLSIAGPGAPAFNNVHSPTTTVAVTLYGQYTFVWNEDNGNGCNNSDTVIITFNYIPASTFDLSNINCFGDNSTVTYTGDGLSGATYTWSFGTATVVSGSGQGPYSINYATDGTYPVSLQITQNGCVSNTTSQNIINPPALTLGLTNYNVTCFGSNNGAVTSTVGGGTLPYHYLWSNGSVFSSVPSAIAGTYMLTVTDNNGCQITEDVVVLEPPKLAIDVPGYMAICNNSSVTIFAAVTGGTFPYTLLWNTGFTTPSITVSPDTTTHYFVTATDANGCTSTSDIEVFVYPPLVLAASSSADSICLGEGVIINSSVSGGNNGPYSYYLNGALVEIPYYLYPNMSQSYHLEVRDGCQYSAQINIPVFVNPSPSISPSSDNIDGCIPLAIQFNESSPDEGQTYLWEFGDNESAYVKNPLHIFNQSGTFDVSLTITNIYGCKVNHFYPSWITAYPLPEAQFQPNPNIASIIKPIISFENYSTITDSVMWYFGDGDSSSVYNPTHHYPSSPTGIYEVTLIVFSSHGCSDTIHGTVEIKDEFTFYAPTGFSPDNDGINEVFMVTGSGIKDNTFHMQVYDRWGEVIFETNDILQGWDGKVKGGKKAIFGSYAWVATFRDFKKILHERTGIVTIIR